MTELEFCKRSTEELTISGTSSTEAVELRVAGTADNDKELLDEVLGGVHAHVLAHATKLVRVDMRDLEFMSSSCIKSFVVWVEKIQALDAEKLYHVLILSSASHRWQRRSLSALSCFAADLIEVETS